jgi:thiol-disulfide isomerase/thioredoxin
MTISEIRNWIRVSYLASAALVLGLISRPAAAQVMATGSQTTGGQSAPAAIPAMMMGPTAPDFPPGTFSDGGHYKLNDFQGKLLVLFFYEKECPTCRGLIPTRNAVVDQFKDSPVKFIAVGPNDSMSDVISYMKGTHLEMITFADTLGVMEARYGFHISLKNIYQFRYLGPNGNVIDQGIDLTTEKVANALKSVKWKYKDDGYDPHLNTAIELLEWNQYPAGLQQLRPWFKNKTVSESAKKLYAVVKAEGQQWLDQADQVKASDPAQAYDLYTKVSASFVGDDLSKTADDALKTLKNDPAVKDELAARQMYQPLDVAMTRAKTKDRAEVANYALSISTKFPATRTGQKAAQLAQDLKNEELWASTK